MFSQVKPVWISLVQSPDSRIAENFGDRWRTRSPGCRGAWQNEQPARRPVSRIADNLGAELSTTHALGGALFFLVLLSLVLSVYHKTVALRPVLRCCRLMLTQFRSCPVPNCGPTFSQIKPVRISPVQRPDPQIAENFGGRVARPVSTGRERTARQPATGPKARFRIAENIGEQGRNRFPPITRHLADRSDACGKAEPAPPP